MSKKPFSDKTFTEEEINKEKDNISYLNHVEIICVDDVEPENQAWLWDKVIPLNAFTLFAGVGGLGKSQLLMFLAAVVSTGKSFSAGGQTHQLPQGAVIILSSEDSIKTAISPRLRALNADTTQIHIIKSVINSKDPSKKRLMALDQDLQLLKNTIKHLKDTKNQTVKLIILDPIINFIGKVKDYINTEVSNFLYGLTDLSEEFGLSTIINKHLRKKDSAGFSSAIEEIAGSSAWANTARQVWIICRDLEDKEKISFIDGKTNIQKSRTGLAFNIKSAEFLDKNKKSVKTSKIEWLDEIITLSADESLNEEKYNKSKMQIAKEFIISYLDKNKERSNEEVKEKALEAKISRTTFLEALRLLLEEKKIVRLEGYNKYKYNLALAT